MNSPPKRKTVAPEAGTETVSGISSDAGRKVRYWRRIASMTAAVFGLYIGGFLWSEVSPVAYSVVFLIIASSPLLLKISFWKKILLLFPLLVLRVMGKVLIRLFGLKALERLFLRYGLLEVRYNKLVNGFSGTRLVLVNRWNGFSRTSKGHLILAFMPFLALIAVGLLVIKLLRFRLLQMVVEKVMQKGVEKKVQAGVESASLRLKQRNTTEDSPTDKKPN